MCSIHVCMQYAYQNCMMSSCCWAMFCTTRREVYPSPCLDTMLSLVKNVSQCTGYASMSVLHKGLYSSVCQITHQAPNTLLSLTHTAMAHLAQGKFQLKVLPSAFYLANLCNYILFHLLPSVAFVKKTKGVLSEWSHSQSVNSCFITFVIFISYVAFTYYFRFQLLSYPYTYHIHHIYAYFVSVYFGCGPEYQ